MTVIGRASKLREEIDIEYCAAKNIPILRRCSGGASIVTGPGCLMYAVVLSLHRHPQLRMIDKAHAFVVKKIEDGLRAGGINASMQGTSDLTVNDRKFSGNSLRCKRNAILYHGTILCEMDLQTVCDSLRTAPRQPDYRNQRSHSDLIANLDVPTHLIRSHLINGWNASSPLIEWPRVKTAELVANRYSQVEWNERL